MLIFIVIVTTLCVLAAIQTWREMEEANEKAKGYVLTSLRHAALGFLINLGLAIAGSYLIIKEFI